MAIVVSDSFDRANNPTSLGTADTGQVWNQITGISGSFGISSNNALWTWNSGDGDGRIVLESGVINATISAVFVNPTSGTQNFATGMGLIFRWVDINNFWQITYYKFPGPANRLRLQRTYGGSTTTALDLTVTLSDGDVVAVTYCGTDFEVFINDISQGTYDDSANPQNYGTQCGLIGDSGTYFTTLEKRFDDFLVETDVACPNPGAAWELPAMEWSAEAGVRRPSGGMLTQRFDAGTLGNSWYLIPQLSDSGDNLRDKHIKAARVTGKVTDANFKVYKYGATDPIVMDDLTDGTNSITGPVALTDNTHVTQSQRYQINVPNAALHTIRVEGTWDGAGIKDRVDEIEYEVAEQGIRR